MNVATHLYAGGRFVWIDGAVPGADVTMLANGAVIGTGTADEGVARLDLTNTIPDGGWMVAHQSAPGLGPGPDVGRAADKISGGRAGRCRRRSCSYRSAVATRRSKSRVSSTAPR